MLNKTVLCSCLTCWRFVLFNKNSKWNFGGCQGNGVQSKAAATQPFRECWESWESHIKFLRDNGWDVELDIVRARLKG